MITLTAPIELNVKMNMVSAGEGFCNRISANYDMFSRDIASEEMLHITTEPPQFYFGGSDTSNISSTSNININQENTTRIINNLVNRIMVEPSFGMVYQDRVYISNAIRKLGIRDEKTFMKQVFNLKEEINQTNRLINMYFSNEEDIRSRIDEFITNRRDYTSETNVSERNDIHLHEDILNRLKSALIYSVVNNHHENAYGADVISTNEMRISEQRRNYEILLLNQIVNTVRGERLPLTYRRENFYEEYEFNEENTGEEHINQVIDAASLLNYIYSAMETKSTALNNNVNIWYEVRPDVQSLSQNTLLRMESFVRNEAAYNIQNESKQEYLTEAELILNEVTDSNLSLEEQQLILEQNLREESQVNLENRVRYEQIVQQEREKLQRRLTQEERAQRQRQDSIAALSSPEEVIKTLRKEQAQADSNKMLIEEQAARENLRDADLAVDLIQRYLEDPSQGIPGAIITRDDYGSLAGDIAMVERNQREIEAREEIRRETIERVSREVTKELAGDIREDSIRSEEQSRLSYVELRHKSQETLDFEEVTEQLMEQNRWLYEHTTKNENVTTEQNVSRNRVINENVVHTDTINRDIEQAVESTVTRQVNMLSDQIYRNIESKLELEKRRRGF